MAFNTCPLCLEKQWKIAQLTEAVARLKQKLHYQERQAAEGFFWLFHSLRPNPGQGQHPAETGAQAHRGEAGASGMGTQTLPGGGRSGARGGGGAYSLPGARRAASRQGA